MYVDRPLNERQVELLRHLSRQTSPVPANDLDGRVLRALKSRQLIHERDDGVSLSSRGRDEFETKFRRRRAFSPHSVESNTRSARAESMKRAIEALELALPHDAELMVGEIPASTDDILHGLRRFTRLLERI